MLPVHLYMHRRCKKSGTQRKAAQETKQESGTQRKAAQELKQKKNFVHYFMSSMIKSPKLPGYVAKMSIP